MKRLIATALFVTAFSVPALAESPTQRTMHSWDYVQTVGNPAPVVTPMPAEHVEHPHYRHENEAHHGKHHHKHHEGKAAPEHKGGKHHHHKMKDKPAEAPKQQ